MAWPRQIGSILDSASRLGAAALVVSALAAGCASNETWSPTNVERPADARARIASLLPQGVTDRNGWATDIYAAFAALRLAPTNENVCAVIGVTEQESSFRADPSVPNLASITWAEIERRAERAGVPMFAVRAALSLSSPNGKSYAQRIDAAKTERELSEVFEDFIDMVPLGKRFFSGWNPVRTGGPMQVSVAYAESQAKAKPYPYPVEGNLRHEVFTRRGGLYFGIAHLLDYPASYDKLIYRYADFNAGHYASRNAALQNAIGVASGIPLVLDGDLVIGDGSDAKKIGATEAAARALASRLDLNDAQIRRTLEEERSVALEETALYRRVFALADRVDGRTLPRAVMPQIELHSPKITRKLTTEWFAQRVDERWRRCMARAAAANGE